MFKFGQNCSLFQKFVVKDCILYARDRKMDPFTPIPAPIIFSHRGQMTHCSDYAKLLKIRLYSASFDGIMDPIRTNTSFNII